MMPPRCAISGFGRYFLRFGEKRIANPDTAEKTPAPRANALLQPDKRRPRNDAAIPTASKLTTSPKKKDSEISRPRRLRLPSGALSTCDPTKPTTPTPAGIVHGQVLVEKSPPSNAINKANAGYCSINVETLSKYSNGFINLSSVNGSLTVPTHCAADLH